MMIAHDMSEEQAGALALVLGYLDADLEAQAAQADAGWQVTVANSADPDAGTVVLCNRTQVLDWIAEELNV